MIKNLMKIHIHHLQFMTIIGLLPKEREQPQNVIVDCQIEYPYHEGHFLDYSIVRDYLMKTIQKECFGRLEDALIFLIDGIKKLFIFITAIEIEIIKPQIFDDCQVSVKQKVYFN